MFPALERTFGIEMEYGYNFNDVDEDFLSDEIEGVLRAGGFRHRSREWHISEDGGGYEVRTPIMTWADWPELQAVTRKLREYGRYTSQAGMHVHLGLGNMLSDEQIARWGLLWLAVEDAMFKLVHRHRHGNTWCRPLASDHSWEEVRHWFMDLRHFRWVHQTNRRALHVISRHGTSECRLHQASLDPVKQKSWLLTLQAMMQHAEEETDVTRIVALYPLTIEDKLRKVQQMAQEHLPSKLGSWTTTKIAERAQRYSSITL